MLRLQGTLAHKSATASCEASISIPQRGNTSDSNEDKFEASPTEVKAANLIQAQVKSFLKTRSVLRNTVSPKKIYDFFSDSLLKIYSEDARLVCVSDLSWTCAREIIAFLEKHPKSHITSRRCDAFAKHRFPVFSKNNAFEKTCEVNLPVSIWIRRLPRKTELEVELIGEFLGKGSFKKVFKSTILTIDLASNPHKMCAKDAALVRIKNAPKVDFRKGIGLLRQYFSKEELASKSFQIAGNLKLWRKFGNKIEARDHLCDGDLIDKMDEMSLQQKISAYKDVSHLLREFHSRGLVHSDVKLGNILVKLKESKGYLADPDFLKPIGLIDGGTLDFVDKMALSGIATPFHDIYGLSVCVAITVFGVLETYPKSADYIRALIKQFKKMRFQNRKALAPLFKSLVGVIRANEQTVGFSLSKNGLRHKLLEGTAEEREGAMRELNKKFPAFKQFLDAIEKTSLT